MSRKVKAILLASTAAVALPMSATPAQADPVDWGCDFVAVRDVTDRIGKETWVELTASYFVGTADTTSWEVTCWLQTEAALGAPELPNTRHTCSGSEPQTAGACANPVIFEIQETDVLYQCAHVEWVATTTVHLPTAGDPVFDLVEDAFNTGGLTTLGGAVEIVDAIVAAILALAGDIPGPGDIVDVTAGPTAHTLTVDFDDNVDGVQCSVVRTVDYAQTG